MATRYYLARLAPVALAASLASACSSEPQKPAVDAKQLEMRMTQAIDAIVKAENPDLKVTAAGPVKVETKDDGTVIGTTPALTIKGSEGNSTTIESFVVTFKRGENENSIPFDLKVPSTLTPRDSKGKAMADVKLGGQTIQGVWRDDLQQADKFIAKLTNFTVVPADKAGKFTIAELSMKSDVTDKGQGLYDVKVSGKVSNLSFDDPASKSTMRMGEIGFGGTMSGAKLLEYGKAAKEAGYTISNPDFFKQWTSGKLDDKMMAFIMRMPEFLGAIDYGYDVRDIAMSEGGKPQFALAKASFGLGIKPQGADYAMANIRMTFGGMKAEGPDGKPMIPAEADIKDSSLDVDISGVPAREIWAIYMKILPQMQQMSMADAAGASPAQQEAMNKISEEAGMQFVAALQKATLNVNLKKADVITPTITMGGTGNATYNFAKNPMMPVGKFTFRFTGIDALQEAMQKRGPNDATAQEVLTGLMGLKAFAKPDPKAAKGGQMIEVEFTKDGRFLANGQQLMGPPPQ